MRAARTAARAPRAPLDARPGRSLAPRTSVGAREGARRRLVNVVLAIYILAIVEGSIRKFVLPQLSQYIFFIRDPFLLYAYLLATRHGLWPRNSVFFSISVAMLGLGLVLFGLQGALGGLDNTRMLLGVYGWRGYFLYVPLACLVGAQFDAADLTRFAKVTLWLAIPVAVLVTLQFASSPTSPINVGTASEDELQFKGIGLDAEHIRPTGPFTSVTGQAQFVTTAWAFLLALFLRSPAQRKVGVTFLAVAAAAIFTCLALGGSRGTTLSCGLVALYAAAMGVLGRGAGLKARAIGLPAGLAALAVTLYPIIFPVGFKTFVERWQTAAVAEQGFEGGVFGRALYGFVDFLRLIEAVPALGYGLGYGGNASTTLAATIDGVKPGQLAETDFARQMVDLGPAIGLCYIALRLGLVAWLALAVWRATRRSSDPLPMMMFSYSSLLLLLGQITGHGTINVYGWLFTGFTIAAVRVATRPGNVPVTTVQPRRRGVFAFARAPRAPSGVHPRHLLALAHR